MNPPSGDLPAEPSGRSEPVHFSQQNGQETLEQLPAQRPTESTAAPLFSPTDSAARPIVVLIDGANLFYAAASLGIEIDYAKLLAYLRQFGPIFQAIFYTGMDPRNVKQQAFLHWMERNGYRVMTKDLTLQAEGLKRANMNVEIGVDMLKVAQDCQIQVLISGDGHLTYAVETVKSLGVQVHIIALGSMVSDRLLQLADRFIDLREIQSQIRKSPTVGA